MKKPKIFMNEHGHLVVIFPKQYNHNNCRVLVVHDRGQEAYHRYQTHPATAYGDTGKSYSEDELAVIDNMTQFFLSKKKYVGKEDE